MCVFICRRMSSRLPDLGCRAGLHLISPGLTEPRGNSCRLQADCSIPFPGAHLGPGLWVLTGGPLRFWLLLQPPPEAWFWPQFYRELVLGAGPTQSTSQSLSDIPHKIN